LLIGFLRGETTGLQQEKHVAKICIANRSAQWHLRGRRRTGILAPMRAVVQRVTKASVTSGGELKGAIGDGVFGGLLVYLGVAVEDEATDADWLAEKIAGLRIFADAEGKMNLSVVEAAERAGRQPAVLAVSQFTLMGDVRKGRRPSWARAAPPEKGRYLYEYFMEQMRRRGFVCESGEFQAHMAVSSVNDGPVTILLDSNG